MKSKVLLFVSSLTSGGAERVTVSLAENLIRSDYNVVLVTLRNKNHDFYSLKSEIKRMEIRDYGKGKGVKKIITNARRILDYRDIIKKEKPDIIIGIMTLESVMSIISSLGEGIPVITAERNNPKKKSIHFAWYYLRKYLYRFAYGHIVQTNNTKIWLEKNCGANNISVIPNPLNSKIDNDNKKLNKYPKNYINDNENMILAVGSLSYQKGFDLLIKSFSLIAKEFDKWKLVIVGGDSKKNGEMNLLPYLLKLCKDNDCADRVVFPGKVGNISDWYKRASIFVLSSRYEGYPNVLLEALSHGCPSIAFNCETGPKEMIINEYNGLLVKDGNINDLHKGIKKLIISDRIRNRISKNAVGVIEDHNPEYIFSMWKKIINNAINNNK